MESKLLSLAVKGFRSIADAELSFNQLNVLIGPNGAGKSNLIAFFRMLGYMLSPPMGSLQLYIAENGGASALLHDGSRKTREIEAHLSLETGQGTNEYRFRLFYVAGDTLIFAEEGCRFSSRRYQTENKWLELGGGHREAVLLEKSDASEIGKKTIPTILGLLRKLVVYQFHDTSATARVKTKWAIDDSSYLKHDAANLAPFLYKLRNNQPKYYRRIVETVRQVAPFFDDFVLEPEYGRIMLQWREKGSDVVFSAHQISDGTLRAIALISLLLQPPEGLPALLILDEPELGLHPYAVTIIGGLIKSVASARQVLIATQSPMFLDQFAASDVIVVERNNRDTSFQRLDESKLTGWMADYSLSELWNKNVLGGRPREEAR